jgi:hypothetical protein
MTTGAVLTVFVVIAALAFLAQAILLALLYVSIRELPAQIGGIRADVKQRLDPLTQSISEILANSREPVQTITTNLAEISRILRERAGHIDGLVADLVDKSRLQVIRADQLISGLAAKVESAADTVEKQVLAPIQELAALIKGVRSGLLFLFSRRRVSSVTEATQDEQMFI